MSGSTAWKRAGMSIGGPMLLVFVLLVLAACGGSKDARAMWRDAIKKCATNDLIGPNVLYFGPSNVLGPGTVFQKFKEGGTQPSHLLAEYERNPSSLMAPAGGATCAVDSSSKFQLGANVNLQQTLPVAGDISLNLQKAKTIKVQTKSWAWDQLVTGPYKEKILALPDQNLVKQDLLQNGHLVLTRALKIGGIKAELEFKSDVGADVKVKIPAGNVSPGVNAKWEGDTKLTLETAAEFYVAGELRQFSTVGFAGGEKEVGPLVTGVEKIKVGPFAQR